MGRRGIALNPADDGVVALLYAERFGQVGCQVLDGDADAAAPDFAMLDQLLHHPRCHCDWNRKANTDIAAGRRDDGSVDANEQPVRGDQRTSRVAGLIDASAWMKYFLSTRAHRMLTV